MPSFDIVSQFDQHEATNAVDQANRELQTRFDFKNIPASFSWENGKIKLETESLFQLQQMLEILRAKIIKRGIDVRVLEPEEASQSSFKAQQLVNLKQGLTTEQAKKLVNQIKALKIKVQSTIQNEQIRVAAKKKDDLQQIIAHLKATEQLAIPLQFVNFRD